MTNKKGQKMLGISSTQAQLSAATNNTATSSTLVETEIIHPPMTATSLVTGDHFGHRPIQ